jgi:hypothetical protein
MSSAGAVSVGAWTPAQRGSFTCSASSQGPEMSIAVLSGVVLVRSVEVGSVDVPSEGPTAATTTAANIPSRAMERVNVIAFRMEGSMQASRQAPPSVG